MLFEQHAEGWWQEGTCPYCREEERNGRRLSHAYVSACRTALVHHILPAFGKTEITSIAPGMIDEWKYSLHESKGLSFKSTNNYLATLRVMFSYWWRHGVVATNPCEKVRDMADNCRERGILTEGEVKKLFISNDAWDSEVARLASLTAACTGMRMGEIQALRASDIEGDSIVVSHSWDENVGLKDTKTRTTRVVPVPHSLAEELRGRDGFIFSGENPDKPVYRSAILDGLRRALERIGISADEQRRRNICFHSWRHYLNTLLRKSGIPDAVTRRITGHATQAMTERYSHIDGKDLGVILGTTSRIGGI